ncbi:MAG: DNA gyrase subunit A [Deltaproteobacteria bacterium]|nr:MAG: DNA gyrase subunit A [Deltaproteobacteria bacterium]
MTSETPPDNVQPIALEEEMRSSFMDYAMSVIVSRALPDARDGLKPVHRRILYAQRNLSNYWNRPYLKCARVVGDVIGKYHPHGDAAVYDALVRMAQDFSMRYPLIDGQGNFGSMDGDPPAAMRYTECRMSRLASELLADIDKETVDWQPNYDDKELEPVVLPAKFPNLLVNGSSGIAVGMATNIPPHNMGEVINATLALLRDPDVSDDVLLSLVPGPDFPTGGIIHGREGILRGYRLGRGSIVVRGRATIEEIRKDREAIVVHEIPYMVNKARMIETAAQLVRDKKLDGISDIRDESDRTGVRVVFELKKDANAQVVLNHLYKMTPLQTSFGINMLAIVDGRPQVVTLRRALEVFIEHRREVVTRRSRYELRQARERREIVEGLGLAVIQIDRVIDIIRSSKDTDEAKARLLQEKMGGLDGFLERAGRPAEEVEAARAAGFTYLTERQAQAILDMRLGRLTGLEREKLEAEYKELWEKTDYLEGILRSETRLREVIQQELEDVRDQFADERRTEIVDDGAEIHIEELIDREQMVVTRTHKSYIKRTPVSEYSAQGRGGRGIYGAAASADDDFVADLFVANTHDDLLIFTNTGRVYCRKVYELPAGARTARGKTIQQVVEMQPGETALGMLAIKEFDPNLFVLFATESGVVKKTQLKAYANVRRTGIKAINIDEGDRLVDVRLTTGDMDVLLCTRNGQAIRFSETQVRPMGREARGVRGIALRDGDAVVGMGVFEHDAADTVAIVCERGYGKRTALSEFPRKNRGGYGVIAIKTTSRNGPVTGVRVVSDSDELIFISSVGKLIRVRAADISVLGRPTQGVRIMRVGDQEIVTSMERLADADDDGGADIERATPDAADDDDDGDAAPEPADDDATVPHELDAGETERVPAPPLGDGDGQEDGDA